VAASAPRRAVLLVGGGSFQGFPYRVQISRRPRGRRGSGSCAEQDRLPGLFGADDADRGVDGVRPDHAGAFGRRDRRQRLRSRAARAGAARLGVVDHNRRPGRRSGSSARRPAARRGRARRSSSHCSSSGGAARGADASAAWVWAKTIRSVSYPNRGWATTARRLERVLGRGCCARGRSLGVARGSRRAGQRLLAGLGPLVADHGLKCAALGGSGRRRRWAGREAGVSLRARAAEPRGGGEPARSLRRGGRSAGRGAVGLLAAM